jgi:hypothetical protein
MFPGLQPITQPVTYIVFNATPTSFTVNDIVSLGDFKRPSKLLSEIGIPVICYY